MNTEFVTFQQWDNYARRIETKNLKMHGQSLSFSSIARRAHSHIVVIHNDRGGMIVKVGWRDAMKSNEVSQ